MAYHLTRQEAQDAERLGAESSICTLSIRLRPDGFSLASFRPENRIVTDVAFDEGQYQENLKQALREVVPTDEYTSVRVSLPVADAVLVPTECDRQEIRKFLPSSPTDASKKRPVSIPCGDKNLLMAVPADLDAIFRTEYGDRFEWSHPLAVSLGYADTTFMLRIDTSADCWFACLTLRGQLAAAEALPLENDASLLLAVNRLTVIHKAGALKIVCSGERCEQHAAILAAYYPDVSVDPDGADRDILRLSR